MCSAFLSKQLTSQCQNRCLDLDVWYPNLFVQLNQSIDKNLSHNSSFRWNNWYFYQTVCVCICVCVLYLYFSLRLYLFYWEDSPPPPTQGNINDCSGMSPVISNAVLSRWRPLLHPHNTSYIQFEILKSKICIVRDRISIAALSRCCLSSLISHNEFKETVINQRHRAFEKIKLEMLSFPNVESSPLSAGPHHIQVERYIDETRFALKTVEWC